jgi:hypothetical protein
LPRAPFIAALGFIVTGVIALYSAILGFIRILFPTSYPHELFWVGNYIGPAVLLVASVAALVSLRRSPLPALMAVTALYMSAYFVAEAFGLSKLPYVSFSMMLVYGIAMVFGGIRWKRERQLSAAV